MTPACMTPAELALWNEADAIYRKRTGAPEIIGFPCLDCPLSFATEMREAGSCNGTPGTIRLNDPAVRRPKPRCYSTIEERVEARRLTWRMSKRRAKDRADA